jgi:hypothetical protein
MTLLELAENGQLETIDERWLELLEAPGDVTDAVAALHRLVQNGWTDRAAPLALMLAESLLAANRHADALDVLRPVAGHLPEEESLRKQLLAAVRGKFAGGALGGDLRRGVGPRRGSPHRQGPGAP